LNRGDIRYYTFKTPDKRRPVLVLTRDSLIPHINEITVAPLTSTIRGIPSEVILTPDDGVPESCAVNLDHIQTIPKEKLGRLVATLTLQKMTLVQNSLLFALGFESYS
jgi:mRNA interferase MazF